MATNKPDDLRVYAFCSGWGIPFETSAPFPLKLITWLRMAELPHRVVEANDPSKGPTGKSPWIEYGSVRMGDSSLITEHLRDTFGVDLDAHLTREQRARGLAIQRMLEEHLHQSFEHQLFLGQGGSERLAEFGRTFPMPLCWIVPRVLGRGMARQLHARGVARHAEDVIIEQGKQDLDALSELLGDQPYILGDKPSSFDACMFGFLGVTVYVEGNNPLFRYAASKKKLMQYTERMRARYFPETLDKLAPLFPDEASATNMRLAFKPDEQRRAVVA